EEFLRALKSLRRQQVLSYIPRTDKPQITYLAARVDARNMYLDTVYLKERRRQHSANIQAVLDYAADSSSCRSRLLLAYFGEKSSENCGTCDYCLKLNKAEVTEEEFVAIKLDIERLLAVSPHSFAEITEKVTSYPEIKVLFVIRALLDDGFLIKSKDETNLALLK
ncbi:MAG TPA: RecQ family zinc-binding domain-containing protein, partial [Anseongella sp.]|nr:RecQ family zinc-binding domain-containing protein [Anseongella sp.]